MNILRPHRLLLLVGGLLAFVLAACVQQPEFESFTSPTPEGVTLQLDRVTSHYDSSGLSTQSQALAAQATADVFGSGAKDGPLARVGIHLAHAYRQHQAVEAGLLDGASLRSAAAPIIIDAVATDDPDTLLASLEALGLEGGSVYGRVVSGRLPVAAIADAAQLDGLLSMRPTAAITDGGLVTSEADVAMRTDEVRRKLGYDGSGTMVGILSDSFNRVNVDCPQDPSQGVVQPDGSALAATYADDIASGDLPDDVLILDDSVPCLGVGDLIDEGRGMAHLVYDTAPGSDLAFHTAFNGQADFANGIIELALAGSDVIVDDIIYFAEPMFQDGIIAQAADAVATVLDVPYFSSAGNRSNRSYEAPFDNSGVPSFLGGVLHDFDPGPDVQLCQLFTLQPGQTAIPVLQWDEPFASTSLSSPGSASDVDLFLTFDDCTPIGFGFASFDGNIGADPVEIVGVGVSDPLTLGIAISLYEGPEPGLLKYVNFGSSDVAFDPPLDAPTSYGHNNAAHARGVAAAFWGDGQRFGAPRRLEDFSSFGGIPTLFDIDGNRYARPMVRQQPDITAPDGTNTTFFFRDSVRDDDDGDGMFMTGEEGEFPNFFGTSAAAPHAAAVAALISQAHPNWSAEDIYHQLEVTAKNIGPGRVDFQAGWGAIDAFAALKRGKK